MNAVRTEHVRDLVRIGDNGRRPEREHEAGELVRQELRRLDVHVRVDEAGHQVGAADVQPVLALVAAEPDHMALPDCHVGVQPFFGEGREDFASGQNQVGPPIFFDRFGQC